MKNKKTILIVEDEQDFLRIYTDLFVSQGYQVEQSSDGAHVLEKVERMNPDLVLLDIVLPNMNGLDILKGIRNNPKISTIPVIIFSVLGDSKQIKAGLDLGANDYLVKGFYSPAVILKKVEDVFTKNSKVHGMDSYKLEVKPQTLDYARINNYLGLDQLLKCQKCGEDLILEMIPDYTRINSHWFFTHFICSKCGLEA